MCAKNCCRCCFLFAYFCFCRLVLAWFAFLCPQNLFVKKIGWLEIVQITSFTILLKQVKILIVILLTLNTSQQLNSLFSDFEQVKNLLVIFAGFKKLTSYFCLLWTSYKLLSEKLHDLLDAMWCYWSLCFLMSPCYLQDAMLMVMQWSTTSAVDLREHYLLSGNFYLTSLPAVFKASLGAGSSTSKLAGLHADLRNIVPVWLFVWITTIHKRGMVAGFI